jgi:hypothetical protein
MKSKTKFMASVGLAIAMYTTPVAARAATPAENQKFVNKLYHDLLSRTPGRAESATYTALLGFGMTRTQVAGAITSSNEYRGDLVQQYFNVYLSRAASAGEISFFVNLFAQGATDDDVKAAILGSDEYHRLSGGTPRGFLNKLYMDVLGRPIDRAGEMTFEAMMGQGATRQMIASLVLHSVEADQRVLTQLYQKLLNRAPQAAELAVMTQLLQTGGKEEYVIDLLSGSDEYFALAQI